MRLPAHSLDPNLIKNQWKVSQSEILNDDLLPQHKHQWLSKVQDIWDGIGFLRDFVTPLWIRPKQVSI